MEKLTAFVLLIVLLIFTFYFVYEQKINNISFTLIVTVLFVAFIAFYSLDRLKELDLKQMRLVLGEMKETKSSFDKEVDLLLNTLSDYMIDSALRSGRWDEDTIKQLLSKKNAAFKLLSAAGKPKNEIEKKLSIIDSYVLGDIADYIIYKIKNENQEAKNSLNNQLNQLSKNVRDSTPTIDTIDKFNKSLQELNINTDDYSEFIQAMYDFIKSNEVNITIEY